MSISNLPGWAYFTLYEITLDSLVLNLWIVNSCSHRHCNSVFLCFEFKLHLCFSIIGHGEKKKCYILGIMIIVNISMEMPESLCSPIQNKPNTHYQFDCTQVCLAEGLYFVHNKNSRHAEAFALISALCSHDTAFAFTCGIVQIVLFKDEHLWHTWQCATTCASCSSICFQAVWLCALCACHILCLCLWYSFSSSDCVMIRTSI